MQRFIIFFYSATFFLHYPECTFIILDAEQWSSQKATEEDCMVGDVNLFLTNSEDPTVGEIEIMIAGHLIVSSVLPCLPVFVLFLYHFSSKQSQGDLEDQKKERRR